MTNASERDAGTMQRQNREPARKPSRLLGPVVLCALALALLAPGFASASESREYDSQITGFSKPEAVTIGANDEVWVSDIGQGSTISHYDAYPSQTKLGVQTGGGRWGGLQAIRGPAVSQANGFLYASPGGFSGCSRSFSYLFDDFGDIYRKKELEGFPCAKWFAADNAPSSDSYGHFYLYTGQNGNAVENLDGYGNAVDFTAAASYIEGPRLTGTPEGNFSGEASGGNHPNDSGITVDAEGNIWVLDSGKREIDEFAPSGLFIRSITALSSGVPEETKYGSYPGLASVAVDPTNGTVFVSDKLNGIVDEFSDDGKFLGHLTGADTPAGEFAIRCFRPAGPGGFEFCTDDVIGIAVNSQGYVYVADGFAGAVNIFKPKPFAAIEVKEPSNATQTSGTLNATVDPNGGGDITGCKVEYGLDTSYSQTAVPCSPDPSVTPLGAPTAVHVDLAGLTTESAYHYRFAVTDANGTRHSPDRTFTPHDVIGLSADAATAVTAGTATLNGSFVGNGVDTHYYFEWGADAEYGNTTPAPPGLDAGSPTGPGRTSVHVDLAGLVPATRYHFRVVADNGTVSKSDDQSFRTAPLLPQVRQSAGSIHSDSAEIKVSINPGGADTVFNVEYGTQDCSLAPGNCTPASANGRHVGSNLSFDQSPFTIEGLAPSTTYYYRVVATNSAGTVTGDVGTFETFPFSESIKDTCENTLARQQSGAALLSDCRGYELVSSPHAGGYDVESNLVPGQKPFDGYPEADGATPRVLYGVHNGAIPGVSGNPTNRGIDPYVATRTEAGWTTSYVGLAADNPYATEPFSSTLAEANSVLNTFAFGGGGLCSPCFADGSTGIPVRESDGSLVQGMAGSQPQPGATQDGLVKRHFSDDGTHFVFSSTSPFEPGGNADTGDVSIYDRNLQTGTTQVVSKDAGDANLTCAQGAGSCHLPGNGNGIAELDISHDGSRVVVGQKLSTDAAGNGRYHLFMHVGTAAGSVDLTPGATSGAYYDGMSDDGSRVFFTTTDHLLGTDTDASADVYEAAVDGGGAATVRLLSVKDGAPSNDDGCAPPNTPNSWNSITGDGHCNAVAFAGSAGVAGNGTFYFLSPELLDGAQGEANQANLYVVTPGAEPSFVATMDSSKGKPEPPRGDHVRVPGSFASGLEGADSIAVDQSNGDVYVGEKEGLAVARFTSTGQPHKFTEGPDAGTNRIAEQTFGGGGEGDIAVDNAPGSPVSGDVYVTTNGDHVNVFANTGKPLGQLTGFGEACGIAIDQSNGAVYVGDFANHIWRYLPVSSGATISDADYVKTGITLKENTIAICPVGTDSSGHVFGVGYAGGPIREYKDSAFKASVPTVPGVLSRQSPNNKIYTDPSNDDRYIDTGEEIVWTNAAGETLGKFGSGEMAFSQGVAVNAATGHVYVSSESQVIEFGFKQQPYEPIDNPAIVNGVHDPETHRYGDFQTTPSGEYAAFASNNRLLPSFDNAGFNEVFRYAASDEDLNCVSCPPTNTEPVGDSRLASDGLSVTEDGKVFFDSNDVLALRDGDGRQDVYEWEPADPTFCTASNPTHFNGGFCLSLISSGTSPFDSSLLTASADGVDAYFFTHDTLTKEDENGPVTKIYDARVNGGVFHVPPPALCAASDECHGPGTEAPPVPSIRTKAGTPGNTKNAVKCKKGTVKKHGKCVKKTKKKKTKRKHHRKSGSHR